MSKKPVVNFTLNIRPTRRQGEDKIIMGHTFYPRRRYDLEDEMMDELVCFLQDYYNKGYENNYVRFKIVVKVDFKDTFKERLVEIKNRPDMKFPYFFSIKEMRKEIIQILKINKKIPEIPKPYAGVLENNENIYNYLKSIGFNIVDQNMKRNLGERYHLLTNQSLELKFSKPDKEHKRDKPSEKIEIRKPGEDWINMELIKILLCNETDFSVKITAEELKTFIQYNMDSISNLFTDDNYLTTKEKLKNIIQQRLKFKFSIYE